MSRVCEHFKINEHGVCENFIVTEEVKRKKTSCSYSCKVYKMKGKKSKLRTILDNQITGIYVPYETKADEKEIKDDTE